MSTAICLERCIQKQKYSACWMLSDRLIYLEVPPIVRWSVTASYVWIMLLNWKTVKYSLNMTYERARSTKVSFRVKWNISRIIPFTGRVGTTGACITSGCLQLTTKKYKYFAFVQVFCT